MIVLGINASHNATACLLKNGKIVSCISEERLTRVKNQSGVPFKAISRVLLESKIKTEQIDYVSFGFKEISVNTGFSVLKSGNKSFTNAWKTKEWLLANIPYTRNLYLMFKPFYYKNFIDPEMKEKFLKNFERKTKISRKKIRFTDHHTAHAYTAYYGSPGYLNSKKLVFTLDAMGDGLCATVSIGQKGKLRRISETKEGNSIGDLYAYVTRYLGMKMGEHEYKVMGLAAYANQKYVDSIYQKISNWITVDKEKLRFRSKYFSHTYYKKLNSVFENERFDNISAAIQRLTEERVSEWVEATIKATGVNNVVCAGGVFMNVKANQKVSELKKLKSLFVFPSGGDESTAIGAAYYTYLKNKDDDLPEIDPINDIYYGPSFSEKQILKTIRRIKNRYTVKRVSNIEKSIALLLSKGKIVARFAGKMEWGARSLGNRSILTHPQNLAGVREINEQIKNRDFWMPFAPSVLSERLSKYVHNSKKTQAPYMVLGFETTKTGSDKLRAAIHQYDFSARPQEVLKTHNPKYHKLISEFEKITGIAAVLNTSFNLHGYPIVCSPEDALFVFKNSGLKYLALENYLLQKK